MENNEVGSDAQRFEAEENEGKFRLKVLTPGRVVFDQLIEMVVARTTDGDMGILPGHEQCSALMSDSLLRIIHDRQNHNEELLMVLGGIITVHDGDAIVLSGLAEYPDKLQAHLDQLMAEKEEKILKEQIADMQSYRMERAIRQALMHIDVSPYTVIRKTTDEKR